jgi:hypothetical protein
VAPIRDIAGSNTGLDGCSGIAVDHAGKLYVANSGPQQGSITIYADGATGDIAPVAMIKGPQTKLAIPQALALDTAGRIYVTNSPASFIPGPDVVIFAPDANGDVAPIAIIDGPTTGLGVQPEITTALGDQIYVSHGQWGTAVSVFPAGANGDVPPLATLEGNATLVGACGGIAIGYQWRCPRLVNAPPDL